MILFAEILMHSIVLFLLLFGWFCCLGKGRILYTLLVKSISIVLLLQLSTHNVTRTYPYLPHGRVFSKTTSPPLWKFQLSFIHFFIFFGHTEPSPPPLGNSNPFHGGSMDIFWNCTFFSKSQPLVYSKNIFISTQ